MMPSSENDPSIPVSEAPVTVPYLAVQYPHSDVSVVAQGRLTEIKRAVRGRLADAGKVTSGAAEDEAAKNSHACGEIWKARSSSIGDESIETQDITAESKRTLSVALTKGQVAQVAGQYDRFTPESSHSGRVGKLPVTAPGRATLPGPAFNQTTGMDSWSAPHTEREDAIAVHNVMNTTPVMPKLEQPMPGCQRMQMSERELRREKRKQANRESARRSRLRKQQECDELAETMTQLTRENDALRVEVAQCKQLLQKLKDEKASLMARLKEDKS